MSIQDAITEIKKFWPADSPFPFGESNNEKAVERLTLEFPVALSQPVIDYVTGYAPAKDFYFTTVGNPMCLYGIDNLKFLQDGYNYNPIKKESISGWNNNFFLVGDEGADPVLVDHENNSAGIQKLMHGAGNWEAGEVIADGIGQFLLCSAAQHHALLNFEEEPIVDDENGFNLAPDAANWYFRNMKKWAGPYYDEWCSVFDNH